MNNQKLIAVTQRVDVIKDYGERRDSLDQRWGAFLAACGFTLVQIPNIGSLTPEWLNNVRPAGIILSGGNDLGALGGDAPERDQSENLAIDWATQFMLPVLGVCRGMQLLAHRTHCQIERRHSHIASRHMVSGAAPAREVNSYHNWCITGASGEWKPLLKCEDGTLEQFQHITRPHIGIMWHPEREAQFNKADIDLFEGHFKTPP